MRACVCTRACVCQIITEKKARKGQARITSVWCWSNFPEKGPQCVAKANGTKHSTPVCGKQVSGFQSSSLSVVLFSCLNRSEDCSCYFFFSPGAPGRFMRPGQRFYLALACFRTRPRVRPRGTCKKAKEGACLASRSSEPAWGNRNK